MRTNDKHQTTHFDSKIRAFEIQEYKIQSWSITFNRNHATCFSTLPTNSPGQRFLPSNNIRKRKAGRKGKTKKKQEWKKREEKISGGIIYRITRIVENCTASCGE